MTSDSSRPTAPRPVWQMGIGCIAIPMLTIFMLGMLLLRFQQRTSDFMRVPKGEVVMLRNAPDDRAALLARYGPGRQLRIVSHGPDWLWLEVERWDGRRAWARRPLDVLPWAIDVEKKSLPDTSLFDAVETTQTGEGSTSMNENRTVLDEDPSAVVPGIDIPAGTFSMGSPEGVGNKDEQPVHMVELSAFRIDRNEVSVGAYWDCVFNGPCEPPFQGWNR